MSCAIFGSNAIWLGENSLTGDEKDSVIGEKKNSVTEGEKEENNLTQIFLGTI